MRIAHVATLVSPGNEYGGPTRVALNQLKALQDRGHEVTLYAAAKGYASIPDEIEGIPLRGFPARMLVPRTGFAGIAAPRMPISILADLRDFDVVHVHLARDLVTLPAAAVALLRKVPVIAQTHGSVDASEYLLAIPLDACLLRPILKRAHTILHLTDLEASDLLEVSRGHVHLTPLPNGVPPATEEVRDIRAQATSKEVIFLARLHPQKNPLEFVDAAIRLAPEFPEYTFTLVGPDGGDGTRVIQRIADARLQDRIQWEGALDPSLTMKRLARSTIMGLPSHNDTFPMSVLEAASIGIPAVVTETCGLAPAIERSRAGLVATHENDSFLKKLRSLMMSEPSVYSYGQNAIQMIKNSFSIDHVASQLEEIYQDALNLRKGSH